MEKFTSSAKIIDGTLILTLPDAIRPVVWQMQLGQTKSSALEVREQNDGSWLLLLKTPRMDVMEIAPFATKDGAVKALLAVSKAMERAHGQLGVSGYSYPVPAVIPHSGRCFLKCLLKTILYVILTLAVLGALFFGFLWWVKPDIAPAPQQESQLDLGNPAAAEARAAPAGTPVSADDYLNNQ